MGSTEVVAAFHQLFYSSCQWVNSTRWMGVSAQKCPLDLWVYQEIIHEIRPDLIVETGTCYGGSALFLSQMCDLVGKGKVVTVDINALDPKTRPNHDRLCYYTGSSTDPKIVNAIGELAEGAKTVMVILDSDHSCNYVIEEMKCYAPFVTNGSYLIVEDTDVNGHPILPDHGPGPFEAVSAFLTSHPEFEVDASREKFMMTQNPRGYLRKR